MQLRDKIVIFVSLVLAVGLLWAAGEQIDPINLKREDMGLVINPALENAPPSLAFATVAMGAFRGLVVDILWMRADNLKQEGQFFDAKQLADWICALQPRFGAVWEFQAWNMAYNISVAIPASQPDQRWRWVKNGYELLRDKGIEINPKNLQLYREMARIFQHKIGGITDDAHKYYKMQLAYALEPLVGRTDAWLFEQMAVAPETWDEIEADPNLMPIVLALRTADEAFRDQERFAGNYLALLGDPNRFSPDAGLVIDQYAKTPELTALDRFLTAYELRHTWKMDPAFMHELNKKYGPLDLQDPNRVIPLDWRHPDSHAIYWAEKGLSLGAGKRDDEGDLSTNEMNTDRIVIHSLQNLYRYGKYSFYQVPVPPPEGSNGPPRMVTDLFLRPDHRMFARYRATARATIDKYKEDRGRYESLLNGYRNFMKNSIFQFYTTGHHGYAQRLYNQMAQEFPNRPEFKTSLMVFCRQRLRDETDGFGINDAREWILAQLHEAYAAYAMGEDDRAARNEAMAEQTWEHYQKVEFPEEDSQERVGLPPMPDMRLLALFDFRDDPMYPPYLKASFMSRMEAERPDMYQEIVNLSEEDMNRILLLQGNRRSTPR